MSRGLNSYANKRDGNEAAIVALWRKMGLQVDNEDQPWDIVLTGPLGIHSRWCEIKMPRNKSNDPKPYTAKQIKTLETWPQNHIPTIVTLEQAKEFGQKVIDDERILREYSPIFLNSFDEADKRKNATDDETTPPVTNTLTKGTGGQHA